MSLPGFRRKYMGTFLNFDLSKYSLIKIMEPLCTCYCIEKFLTSTLNSLVLAVETKPMYI